MRKVSQSYHWLVGGPLDVMVGLTMLAVALAMLARPDGSFTVYTITVSHLSLELWVAVLVLCACLLLAEHITEGVSVAHFIIYEVPLVYLVALFCFYPLYNPNASVVPVIFSIGFLGAINKLNGIRVRLSLLGLNL